MEFVNFVDKIPWESLGICYVFEKNEFGDGSCGIELFL